MNKKELQTKILESRKLGDKVSLMAYQYVMSSIQASEGRINKDLNEEEIFKIIEKEIKSLNEMINVGIAKNGEYTMVEVLSKLLPEKIDIEKYDEIVSDAIALVSATNMKDMGKVMGNIKQKYGSTVDNKQIIEIVKAKLATI